MRSIAEWLLFREATATEFRILNRTRHVAICIDEVDYPSNTNGSAIGIDESFDVLTH